jgi:hypothetical protein
MHRTFRSLITLVVALSILFAVPISAGVRGPAAPQPTLRTADGWIDATLGWLLDTLDVRHPARRHRSPEGIQQKEAAGGSCIDPQGHTKPWCL